MDNDTSAWTLPQIDPAHCTGCGMCVQRCPTAAVDLIAGQATIVRLWACTFCEICERYCPTGAIARPFTIVFAPNTCNPSL